MSVRVNTKINGDAVEFVCEADETLLDVLRNRLGLTGAKEGCSTGDCGACSVTIDGRLTCSCLVLGAEVDGGPARLAAAARRLVATACRQDRGEAQRADRGAAVLDQVAARDPALGHAAHQ